MPRPDRSRPALVDSAARLFRQQGYAATGINQILDSAQVKAGSMYHHFPGGKQELAAAVVTSVGGEIARVLRRALASELPVADIIDGFLDSLTTDQGGGRRDGCPIEPIATESVHVGGPMREASTHAFTEWSAAVARRLRADGWPKDAADRTALAIIALVEGALILSRVMGDRTALDAAKSAVRALLRDARGDES